MAAPSGRLAGQEFPPFVVFKIFCSTQGQGSKHISGKKLGNASQRAVRKISRQSFSFVGTLDYYQDQSESTRNLDESPAYFSGRNNCWRRLSLQNFPGTTIIYAIMDYAQSKTLSDGLKKELKFLLLRPQNKELWYRNWMLQIGATSLNIKGWQFQELKSLRDQSIATEEWEYEAGKLYAWPQALSLEDTGRFPSIADA
ncbi:uncharacterized protein CXorf58 homolog [Sarcoramphus papa]